MPFKSQAQWRKCRAEAARNFYSGKTSKWDCSKWAHESPPYRELPPYLNQPGRDRHEERRKLVRGKIHVGPRGGRYYVKDGHKVYIR